MTDVQEELIAKIASQCADGAMEECKEISGKYAWYYIGEDTVREAVHSFILAALERYRVADLENRTIQEIDLAIAARAALNVLGSLPADFDEYYELAEALKPYENERGEQQPETRTLHVTQAELIEWSKEKVPFEQIRIDHLKRSVFIEAQQADVVTITIDGKTRTIKGEA